MVQTKNKLLFFLLKITFLKSSLNYKLFYTQRDLFQHLKDDLIHFTRRPCISELKLGTNGLTDQTR